ncbi:MAG: GntR family transcriptional regulator [Cyanobacteria bacterium]|nr:GntR family transcriptional regulator [Cyanobacteriota bacterium]
MALSSRPPIQRRKSLSEQVYSALRTGILTGELVPGSRLIETQLTEWLKVSRTPLREALRQLQKEGLITADTHGGLRVITISATDAAELYDCRMALEQLSVAGACDHATAAQLTALEDYVMQAEARGSQSPQIKTLLQWLDLDYQFHHLIAESSGNRRLVSLLDQLFDAMALLRIQTLQHNPSVLDIRLEHRQIYEAIAQRDAATATEAVRFHLLASKARVVQEIQSLHLSQ